MHGLAFRAAGHLCHLHDDAQRLLRMEERFLPARVRIVEADDLVAVALGARARLVDVGDPERDMVHTRSMLGEKAVKKTVGHTTRLENLEAATTGETPLPEVVEARHRAEHGFTAERADEERGDLGEAGNGDRDVIEANGHGIPV